MWHIAIIGAGNLGGRHLQALAMLNEPAMIYIVDVSKEALERSTKWFYEKEPKDTVSIEMCSDIKKLPETIDLVINATSSNVRAQLTARLLKEKKIKYMVLEKVLFQKEEDYAYIADLISQSNCKTWVNCPRRTVSFYQELAKVLKDEKEIQFCMSGVDWGLGCNAVHYLDLAAYLSGDKKFVLSGEKLDDEIRESKRSGFKEVTGIMTGQGDKCTYLSLVSKENGDEPPLITIRTPNIVCLIKETEQKAFMMSSDNKWKLEEYAVVGKYQSELTNLVAEDILNTGECDLTPYAESAEIHLPFIRAMLKFFNKNKNAEERTDLCPIT